MKQLARILIFIFIAINTFGQTPIYSFFSAGHVYGNPNSPHYGIHYPFVDYIPVLNDYPNMDLAFLTGDVVVAPTAAYWDSAQIDFDKFEMPLFIAPGNHDISQEFINRFGYYYQSFIHRNDLFIVLTPGISAWNITGDQLAFLTETLDNNYLSVDRIFIMLHELIWWSPTNEYQDVMINYVPHYPGSTNFDSVVKPLLLSYPNPITLYAGDIGAVSTVSPCMYHQFENITLIASGMGSGVRDNLIITDVYPDSVHYNLVALNGDDIHAMGELSDWAVNAAVPEDLDLTFNVFPNPFQDYLEIKNPGQYKQLKIYNVIGKEILKSQLLPDQNKILDVSFLKKGMYIISLSNQQDEIKLKLIKN